VLAHQQEVKEVEYLPFDVDGDCASKVSCIKAQMMKAAKDGRPWKKTQDDDKVCCVKPLKICWKPHQKNPAKEILPRKSNWKIQLEILTR